MDERHQAESDPVSGAIEQGRSADNTSIGQEARQPLTQPVLFRNLVPEEPTARPLYGGEVVIRNLVPDDPIGKILYRDEAVIRRIYDIVVAAAICDGEHAKRPHSMTWHDLYEHLKSMEWAPRSDTNFDQLVLLLSSAVQDRASVCDLMHRIKDEKAGKSFVRLAYPGMPVRVRGLVQRRGDVSRRVIRLRDDKCSVHVTLDQEHTLYDEFDFLRERFIFVLGLIQSVEKRRMIKAGAVLL